MKAIQRSAYRKAVAAFALLASLCLSGIAMAQEADLLFVNGVVYTVDNEDTMAEALAVKDGRIVYVGSAGGAGKFKGAGTEVVDMAGGLLLPGFTDTHIHSPGPLMVELFDINLFGIYDPEETVRAVADAIKENPDKDGYFGFGYPTNAFTGPEALKGPKKERLDAICADKPIVIFANDGHSFWMNSKALEVSGITRDTGAPEGGVIEKDEATGELWGIAKDTAMMLVKTPSFAHDKMTATLQEYQVAMNGRGYTSVLSIAAFAPAIGAVPWEGFRELERDNALTLKVKGSACVVAADNLEDKVAEFKQLRERYAGDFLKMNTVKFFADGVLDTRTAYLLQPYADDSTNYGQPGWTPDKLNEAVARFNAEGFQVHTHSIGDAATRMVLDAYEYARDNAPAGDYRNTITHLQLVDPQDIPRFKALSVIASIQPYWHMKQPDYWEPVECAAVGERAKREYPLKALFDAGAIVTSSSDSPVTQDPNPMHAIQIGVTRNLLGGPDYGVPDITDMDDPTYLLDAGQRASVKDMIRSFTANSAYTTFSEKDTGSLEVGKWADMVVLDTNILACPPLEIHKAQVMKTYLNGRLVYDVEDELARK